MPCNFSASDYSNRTRHWSVPVRNTGPYPTSSSRWIFQTRDLIQIAVIQLVEDRGKRIGDTGEIAHPPLCGVNGTGDVDDDTERVSMQPRALMGGWKRWAVGGPLRAEIP